jgi:hypothetical protein
MDMRVALDQFKPIAANHRDLRSRPQPRRQAARHCAPSISGRSARPRAMAAVEKVCAKGVLTPDVGGAASTKEVTDAVIEAIYGSNV